MAVPLSCPSCRARLKFKDAPPAGAVARCPRCKGAVPLSPADEATRTHAGPAQALTRPPSADAPTIAVARRNPQGAPSRAEPPALPLAPPEQPDEIGRLGPYRVLDLLGAGGMGVVFRAEEPQLKRLVALKVMLPQFASNPTWKARFLREARAQAAVEHEHVVAIYLVEAERGLAYIAMPLLKGQTLGAALKQNPCPPLKEAVRIGREIAEGLAAAHEVGLIHRDIKPSNVWLDERRRRVKILDFGLARAADAIDTDQVGETQPRTDAPDEELTVQGTILGTPSYMSPEQARGEKVDHRTDLFSLGTVLYQMATGALPFTGQTTTAVIAAVELVRPPAPITRNSDVPPALSDFIMRLLAKAPEDRPASAAEVAEELQRLEAPLTTGPALVATQLHANDPWSDLSDERSAGRSAEPIRRAATRSGRGPILAVTAATCAVAVALVVCVLALESKQPPTKSDPDPPPVAKAAPAPKPVEPAPKSPAPTVPVEPALEIAPPPRPVLFKWPPWPADKDFRPHTSAAGDYRIRFPGFVRSQSTPFIVGKDTVRKLTTDSVTWWNGPVFLVGFVDYPDDAAQQPAGARLDKFRDADKGSNSKILEETEVTVGDKKYPGRDLLVEVAGTFIRKRIVIAGARLYFVAVQGTKEAVTSSAANTFFTSFEITK